MQFERIISSIIPKWEKGSISVLETISKLLQTIKKIYNDNEEEKITKAFFFAIFKVINKLTNYYSNTLISIK
jgi:hypothetical protein